MENGTDSSGIKQVDAWRKGIRGNHVQIINRGIKHWSVKIKRNIKKFIGLAIIVSIIVITLVILNMEDIVILTKVYGTANIETVRMAVI